MSTFVPQNINQNHSQSQFSLPFSSTHSINTSLSKKEDLASTFGSQICLSFSSKAPKRKRFKKMNINAGKVEDEKRDLDLDLMGRTMAKSVSKSNISDVRLK